MAAEEKQEKKKEKNKEKKKEKKEERTRLRTAKKEEKLEKKRQRISLQEEAVARGTTAKRRFVAVTLFATIAMAALSYRLYVIQIQDGKQYAAMAWTQQKIALSGVDDRGTIYDRKQLPLTGDEEEYVYILRRDLLDAEGKRWVRALSGRERRTSNDKYQIIATDTYEEEPSQQLKENYQAYILRLPRRYRKEQPAVYLLGYTRDADGKGMAGLEKAFDSWLSQRDKELYTVADGANRILPGYGIQNSKERSRGLITTLDKELQIQVEEIVGQVVEGRCCAIVTEVSTGDILACATAPGFDPSKVEHLLDSDQEELVNIALQGQYPPGSVFKIAVAAAAIESGACPADHRFTCTGQEEINGVTIRCTATQGHGEVTMEEAFAKSCNCAFIQMGQLAGSQAILDMASRLGFGEQVLTLESGNRSEEPLGMEKAGNLTKAEETAGAGMGNLSIGQGSLLVTPLQVAQMTQIVANGGVSTGLYLVNALKEDSSLRQLPRRSPHRVMKEETAAQLLSMMHQATESGTARSLAGRDCGGKTGSAEAVKNGEDTVHAWFSGVFPARNPRYTITVFVEDGGSGGKVAVPVFERILDRLERASGLA